MIKETAISLVFHSDFFWFIPSSTFNMKTGKHTHSQSRLPTENAEMKSSILIFSD